MHAMGPITEHHGQLNIQRTGDQLCVAVVVFAKEVVVLLCKVVDKGKEEMSAIPVFNKVGALAAQPQSRPNTLPDLLHTPSGLALLEIQGTINLPSHENNDLLPRSDLDSSRPSQETSIGRLIFPDYHPETQDPGSTAWMKRVYLYVGKHQRLTGEVKKLPKAIAIMRRRTTDEYDDMRDPRAAGDMAEELEIMEIVKWKLLFSQRPEPVGSLNGET